MITQILLQLVILAAGFGLLAKGADIFVEGAAGIASKFGIPQIIIGLTVVAMGTSAPEAAVSITAAAEGSADITIGNIVGSNIMNVLVILGLTAVIAPIAVRPPSIRVEIPSTILITLGFLGLGWDGHISRVDGVILWVVFVLFMAQLFFQAKRNKVEEEPEKERAVWLNLIMTVGGLLAIVFGSRIAVDAASAIAAMAGMSERFIGLTIVAFGTSLPELFTSATAARKGNPDIAVGNIIGSNLFNILFVVGTSALLIPVPFAAGFRVDTLVAAASMVLLLVLVLPKRRLGRLGGALMLLCYGGYFAYLLMG